NHLAFAHVSKLNLYWLECRAGNVERVRAVFEWQELKLEAGWCFAAEGEGLLSRCTLAGKECIHAHGDCFGVAPIGEGNRSPYYCVVIRHELNVNILACCNQRQSRCAVSRRGDG